MFWPNFKEVSKLRPYKNTSWAGPRLRHVKRSIRHT